MDSKRIERRLIKSEGYRTHLYKCPADKWTVGVGHNIEDRGLSPAAIAFILREDMDICENELRGSLMYWDDLPGVVQEALMDLCFNMGISRLMKFRNMLKHMESGEWNKASDELLRSVYAKQLPKRALENAELIKSAIEMYKEVS